MKENLYSNRSDMPVILEIKNKTNWLVAFVTSVGLLILFCIILIIVSIGFLQPAGFISFVLPFAALFIFILYIWLWNNFGKTVLTIDDGNLTVQYKNKLFTSPKTYLKEEIDRIETKNFEVERHQLGVRYHFSISGSTYSVILIQKDSEIRIVDWITETKAGEIVDEIQKVWY